MKSTVSVCVLAILVWTASMGVRPLAAQQKGQSNPGTGSNNGTGANGNRDANIPRSSSRSGVPDNSLQPLLFITGSVLLEDGTPPPTGAVVESNCGITTTKHAYVSIDGSFSFQVGDTSPSNVIPDASNTGSGLAPDPFGQGAGTRSFAMLNSCELSASMPGYRSTVARLNVGQETGNVMVGTIFLYPASRVTGTTVSMNDLVAPKDARKDLEKADKELSKNKFDEAEQSLNKAIAVYPNYASAWFRLGQLFARNGRLDQAHKAYVKASQCDNRFVDPLVELAKMAAGESDWQHTREFTARAIELDPIHFPESFYLNAVASYNLSDRESAEKSVRKALLLDTRHQIPREYFLLARILQDKQDEIGEAEQLRSFLKYAPPQDPHAQEARTMLSELEHTNPTIAARRH